MDCNPRVSVLISNEQDVLSESIEHWQLLLSRMVENPCRRVLLALAQAYGERLDRNSPQELLKMVECLRSVLGDEVTAGVERITGREGRSILGFLLELTIGVCYASRRKEVCRKNPETQVVPRKEDLPAVANSRPRGRSTVEKRSQSSDSRVANVHKNGVYSCTVDYASMTMGSTIRSKQSTAETRVYDNFSQMKSEKRLNQSDKKIYTPCRS